MTEPRTILITGCSSPQGLGFATARTLAERGHRVQATVRDHSHDERLRASLEDRLTVHHLDLLDPSTFDPVLEAIGTLDVLVNNAGYGLIGGIEQVELDRARAHFETNFFGTLALTQRVLPLMRTQNHGHIVNVSTIFAAGLCPIAIGYYVASKAALETAAQAMALELAPFNVRVTNYQPGPVATELSREWGSRFSHDEDPAPTLVDDLYRWISDDPDAPALQSPAEVAADLATLIESERVGLAAQSGGSARAYVAGALRDPTRAEELTVLLAAFGHAG